MTPEDAIADRLLRWEEAWEHGRDLPAAELCADAPELEPTLRERIAALKATAWLKAPPTEEGDEDVPRPLAPKLLGGRYRIEALIAEGGHGWVYRAFDVELQRPVAVKIPRRRAIECRHDDLSMEEARRAAGLRHPGVVAVHDVGRDGGECFIVSELVDGEDLARRIARGRPSHEEAARIVAEVAEALHHAHGRGFVHRDVKPANILIDPSGRARIADFGIAATLDDLARGRSATIGTLPYMAPEQVADEVQLIDARTDVYALGVVLYELLTGRSPYQARTPTALREQILFRPPSPIEDDVPPPLAESCLRCLAKHPADRIGSAKELADELRAAPARMRAMRRRRILGVMLATGSIGGVPALGWLVASRKGSPVDVGSHDDASIVRDGSIRFDGRTRIVTPLERFAPSTLEAWVKPDGHVDHGNQFVVGSDVPTRYGLGLSISGAVLSAEYIAGTTFSDRPVPLGRWSHVAAVFGERETRLYLDGRRVHVGPATRALGGTTFVIGCAGLDNPIDHFRGGIRSVRISTGERYADDFAPDPTFRPDARAVLIHDAGCVEGGRVVDLSGNGSHGRIEKAGE